MTTRILIFSCVTLAPLPLLVAGGLMGGWWILAAFLYMTLITFLLDELVQIVSLPSDPEREFPGSDGLSVVLTLAHFPLIFLASLTVAGQTGLTGWQPIVAFLAFGLFFGQVSNSNAHELIHRPSRGLRTLGHWVFISHQFGHHASAHPKIHHRYVASDLDPNSARKGESFYRFLPKAWLGSFVRGWQVETMLHHRAQNPWWRHPYVVHVAGGAVFCVLIWVIGGIGGLLGYLALAAYASAQLMLSDYVQHYGLRRETLAEGQLEPLGPQHSWNAPHWFSTYLMLAAPRHSDHHNHPSRPYPALGLTEKMPTLPRSLPAMGVTALFPHRWRKRMDPLVDNWQVSDPRSAHRTAGKLPSELPQ